MSSTARIGFGIVAMALLSAVAYLSFGGGAAAALPAAAAPPEAPVAAELPASLAANPVLASELPREVPYNQVTRVAREENRIIYTTNYLGEATEVHPDGTVIIYNHKQIMRFPQENNREEVRYCTIKAKPIRSKGVVAIDPDSESPPK